MIQTTLFFILGFLCAAFLALMVAPAIWRRAVALTRKRIEASVPLTMDEIQADKDRLRAEFAMSTRRLEMSLKSFREKASEQIVEINRNRDELKRIAEERDEKNAAVTQMETRAAELRTELRQREEQLQRLTDRLGEHERMLGERAIELEKLGRMYDEASFSASSRQIEIVAQESKLEKLTDDVATLRNERKEADRRVREVVAEHKAARDALREEQKKHAALEKKVERLTTTLSDRDDKLERRERELARLRDQVKGGGATEHDLQQALAEEQEQRAKLEAEVAELTVRLSTLVAGATGGDVEKATAKLESDRKRLEERLTVLTRENKKLRASLDSVERASSDGWDEERRESAVLREQINDLAAEVVNLTAMLDEPDSPIHKALAADTGESRSGMPSLAERIRALQKAAATPR
ncbi:coiled-coil domain-containing protein [Neoaquamicrobium sediminum]|uniref:hypothetical protein n=1 Tax=Neoaquamicrobium sediminum TaxID=1849104 RepID=UPI00156743C0|nr:hypothetical protein [Mesorhizobium sediminum]NRC55884.1 hypothetical protein [Mesorhizobium sediminum]